MILLSKLSVGGCEWPMVLTSGRCGACDFPLEQFRPLRCRCLHLACEGAVKAKIAGAGAQKLMAMRIMARLSTKSSVVTLEFLVR
jgi:hypothetical protein